VGPRLVAVARKEALVAVFPEERAVFRAGAAASDMQALFGVALSPSELFDLLVGVPAKSLKRYEVRWGPALPREVRAILPDGGKLVAKVADAEVDAALPDAAFADPPHEGFRDVDAGEARRLWAR
jgi:hypothetical protein